jgi:hypothetical protein
MAGSYNHIVTAHGNLVSNDTFVDMIENLGDAYEMTEEMYGMIWFLVDKLAEPIDGRARDEAMVMWVEAARRRYKDGLKIAKENKLKRKAR